MTTQPTMVLVHSPLSAPMTWHAVARLFTERGWSVRTPTLTDTVTGDGPYYGTLAAQVAGAVPGPSVLVGHSGAGTLLPVIAAALPQPPRAVVFVDALLPHPGRTWFETATPEMAQLLRGISRAGRLPTWDQWFPPGAVAELIPDPALYRKFVGELPKIPLAYFEETAPAVAPLAPDRCGYLLLSDIYADQADRARDLGWRVSADLTNHLAMLTQPARVVDALGRLLTQFPAN